MVAVRLEDDALDHIAAKLSEAGGLAGLFGRQMLWEPVVFLPDFTDPLLLPDFEQGGVATQAGADAEFAAFAHYLKKRNGRLHSVIFDDPWSHPGDLDYAGAPSDETVTLEGRIAYLHDLAALSPETLWQFRAVAVSFLKIVYISELRDGAIRGLLESGPPDLTETLVRSIRHVAINVYDDETWLVARHEPSD
jgi:hypothetical protein